MISATGGVFQHRVLVWIGLIWVPPALVGPALGALEYAGGRIFTTAGELKPMTEIVNVVSHNPTDAFFRQEEERIRRALGTVVDNLHHIGSTAIVGINARPIIDIMLEVGDLEVLDEHKTAMERLGYEVMGEFGIPGRRYYRKDDLTGKRSRQVHAFQAARPGAERHLAFRDYLIAHPEIAQRYSELKQHLARAHPHDRQTYMDGKAPFIEEHEACALLWKRSRNSV